MVWQTRSSSLSRSLRRLPALVVLIRVYNISTELTKLGTPDMAPSCAEASHCFPSTATPQGVHLSVLLQMADPLEQYWYLLADSGSRFSRPECCSCNELFCIWSSLFLSQLLSDGMNQLFLPPLSSYALKSPFRRYLVP